ncbi:hypothetical protein BC332_11346 [Capsicum chinense]|nr:hypothetical protein BC332_11346 [Capsicum chinense]
MTCSVRYVRGQNKRGFPHRAPAAKPTAPAVAIAIGSGRGRDRPKKTSSEDITEPPQAKKQRGRPKRIILVGATATPLPTASPVPTIFPVSSSEPPYFYTSSSIAGTTKRGMGSGRGNTAPFKRQRVVGMDVFQAENDFKVLNPGMPNSKIYSIGQAKVARSADVTSALVIHQVVLVN